MRKRLPLAGATGALILIASLLAPLAATAHPGQHGPTEGHLVGTGEDGKIEFVSNVEVSGAGPELIADVRVDDRR